MGPLDLLDHVTQVVGLVLDVLPAGFELCVTALELSQPLVRIPHRDALDGRVAVGIEDVALRVLPEQGLRLMLPVQIDEQRAELGEHAHGSGAAVHPGAGSALPHDFPLEDHAPVFGLHPQGGQGRSQTVQGGRGEFKRALDHGLRRAGPYDIG